MWSYCRFRRFPIVIYRSFTKLANSSNTGFASACLSLSPCGTIRAERSSVDFALALPPLHASLVCTVTTYFDTERNVFIDVELRNQLTAVALPNSSKTCVRASQDLRRYVIKPRSKWSRWDSNPRPPRCHRGAFLTAPRPHRDSPMLASARAVRPYGRDQLGALSCRHSRPKWSGPHGTWSPHLL